MAPGLATPLTQKRARMVPLSAADTAFLDALQSPTRGIARNRELITAGRKYDGLLILVDGIAVRSRVLHDGRRQILNIAIPGDIIGFPACFFEAALYTITALTDTRVSALSFTQLLGLFADHPRVAATLFCCRRVFGMTLSSAVQPNRNDSTAAPLPHRMRSPRLPNPAWLTRIRTDFSRSIIRRQHALNPRSIGDYFWI
jgi:CRP-like cAMP-binding protein